MAGSERKNSSKRSPRWWPFKVNVCPTAPVTANINATITNNAFFIKFSYRISTSVNLESVTFGSTMERIVCLFVCSPLSNRILTP